MLEDVVDDDRAVLAGVLGDLAQRRLERRRDDVDAEPLVALGLLADVLERVERAEQRDAAAGDDAFLERRARRVQRVLDAVLALLHLGLGRGADLDDRDAAGELREPLLELLLVVVGRRLLDLRRGSARCAP